MREHWNLLAINESLKEIFNSQSIIAFKGNKNLKVLIGSNKIEKNKVKKNTNTETKTRQMLFMLDKFKITLLQVQKTTTFKSQQNKKIYEIFHNVNCVSSYVICLIRRKSRNKL